MTAPTFFKPSSLAIDPLGQEVGPGDWDYLVDVLDGSHATDRIQTTAIEGLLGGYDSVVYISGTTIYAKRGSQSGANVPFSILDSGSAATPGDVRRVIQSAIDVTTTEGKPVVLVKPGTYTYNSAITLKSNLTIIAYGATFVCSTSGTAGFLAMNQSLGADNVKIYGLTIDCNNHAGPVSIRGQETASQTATNITIQDCIFKKPGSNLELLLFNHVYNDAIAVQTQRHDNIRIVNCEFDGTGGSGTGELCRIENTRNALVVGCRFQNAAGTKTASFNTLRGMR